MSNRLAGKTAFVTRLAGKALVSYRSSVIRLRARAGEQRWNGGCLDGCGGFIADRLDRS